MIDGAGEFGAPVDAARDARRSGRIDPRGWWGAALVLVLVFGPCRSAWSAAAAAAPPAGTTESTVTPDPADARSIRPEPFVLATDGDGFRWIITARWTAPVGYVVLVEPRPGAANESGADRRGDASSSGEARPADPARRGTADADEDDTDEAAGTVFGVARVASPPTHLVAWDQDAWLLYASGSGVEAYHLHIKHNPVHDVWYPVGVPRLQPQPRLRVPGRVLAATAGPAGPEVLIDPGDGSPSLHRLTPIGWQTVRVDPPLEAGIVAAALVALRTSEDAFERVLVTRTAGGTTRVETLLADGTRRLDRTLADPGDDLRAHVVDGVPWLVGRTDDTLAAGPLRAGLGRVRTEVPADVPSSTVGGPDFGLVMGQNDEDLTMRVWSPEGEPLEDARPLATRRIDPTIFLRGPIVMGTTFFMAVVLAVLASRPAPPPEALEGRIAGMRARLAAALIDVALPLLIAIVFLGWSPEGLLLSLLMFQPSPLPWLVLAGMFAVLTLVSGELAGGRTLGKLLLGLEIVDAEGAPVPRGRLLLRWGLRSLAVAFPPLIGFWITHVRHRAVHDLASGSWVIGPPKVAPPEGEDAG